MRHIYIYKRPSIILPSYQTIFVHSVFDVDNLANNMDVAYRFVSHHTVVSDVSLVFLLFLQ